VRSKKRVRAGSNAARTDWKEAPNQAASAFNIVKAQSLAISLSKQLIVLSLHVLQCVVNAGIPQRKARARQRSKGPNVRS
jgi:hypothetical protein